jgi:tRNA pseudouridine synthase 9
METLGSPESLTRLTVKRGEQSPAAPSTRLLPRETGQDIGMCSPVPLSSEAVEVIRRLRNMKVVALPLDFCSVLIRM